MSQAAASAGRASLTPGSLGSLESSGAIKSVCSFGVCRAQFPLAEMGGGDSQLDKDEQLPSSAPRCTSLGNLLPLKISWDRLGHSAVVKIDNQQGPTI